MSSSPIEYFRHMLAEAEYIVEQSGKLQRDEFLIDETRKRAFVRSIEIMVKRQSTSPKNSACNILKLNGAP